MLATDLADVLRGAGRKVKEHPNWKRHHHGEMLGIYGLMWHHTASPPSSGTTGPVAVVRDGRAGLKGPLAQIALDRDLVWHILSSGQSWHGGRGGPHSSIPANDANRRMLGIEILHAGTSAEGWPAARLEDLRIGSAAIVKHYGFPISHLIGHKEWAPGRKIDPYRLNMSDERRRVAALMKTPTPPPVEEDDMPLTDADKNWLTKMVQQQVREELRQVPHKGRSLAEWMRRSANLAENIPRNTWRYPLPDTVKEDVEKDRAWKYLGKRLNGIRDAVDALDEDED